MEVSDKNFNEVVDKAIKTGEQITTIVCPCCGKTYYVTEDEACYTMINRDQEHDYGLDLTKFSGKTLGRKCPYCGFSGSIGISDLFSINNKDEE